MGFLGVPDSTTRRVRHYFEELVQSTGLPFPTCQGSQMTKAEWKSAQLILLTGQSEAHTNYLQPQKQSNELKKSLKNNARVWRTWGFGPLLRLVVPLSRQLSCSLLEVSREGQSATFPLGQKKNCEELLKFSSVRPLSFCLCICWFPECTLGQVWPRSESPLHQNLSSAVIPRHASPPFPKLILSSSPSRCSYLLKEQQKEF